MASTPKPLTPPAKERENANIDDRMAYSVVARSLLTIAIRKARKAAVPIPPVNDSVALAAYIVHWWCMAISKPCGAIGTDQAAQQ